MVNFDTIYPEQNWEKEIVECNECGKQFKGERNKYGKWVSPYKKLAGHILRSNDHENKRWAKRYIAENCKKTGLQEAYHKMGLW